MPWDLSGNEPVYIQIIEHIKLQIALGKYKSGDKLPAVRELAADAAVNPNTMQKALSKLEKEQLLFSKSTAGRFITKDENKLHNLRKDLAENHMLQYINKMQCLGYTKKEAVDMLAKLIDE